MDITGRYKDYSKKTQESIELLVKDLGDDCPESSILLLDLLAEQYEILFDAVADVRKNGYNIKTNNGETQKNRAIQVVNNSMNYITKILANFPASPLSKSRIKKLSDKEEKVDMNEYLKNLLK